MSEPAQYVDRYGNLWFWHPWPSGRMESPAAGHGGTYYDPGYVQATYGPLRLASDVGDAARLSKLLWEARELIDMFADTIEAQIWQRADQPRRAVAEIDAYRAERGWSPNGFGGET